MPIYAEKRRYSHIAEIWEKCGNHIFAQNWHAQSVHVYVQTDINRYHSEPLHGRASRRWRCYAAGQGTGDTTPRETWATASGWHDRCGPACPHHSRHSSTSCQAHQRTTATTILTLIRLIHTHPFIGPLSGTTRVSWYQKGKTNRDFTGARDSERQWHQLGHMQVYTSLQRDYHTSTPPLSFLQAGCPFCRPTNRLKGLKAL